MVTLGQWLADHRGGVPETLWQQLGACVAECGARDGDALEALLLVTGVQLARLRKLSGEGRGDALDLLVADACVTYALERAAAERVEDLDTFASELMTRIAQP
jgi:hypothetical protein